MNATTYQNLDDLLPFERQVIPAEYLGYYAVKRNKFFASIQAFSELWQFYHLLDRIWIREFSDFEFIREETHVTPLNLFMVSHAKIRISIELAFGTNFGEARSILRDAVEYSAHAHHMLKFPSKQSIWINRSLDPKAFRSAFGDKKKEVLFDGLYDLYKDWCLLSDMGSHANIVSLSQHLTIKEEPDGIRRHEVRYSGSQSDEDSELTLLALLATCCKMESVFFSNYKTRLELDDVLGRMRLNLAITGKTLHQRHTAKYGNPSTPTKHDDSH